MPKRLLTLLLLCLLCAPFAAAASPCAESYCFSRADFLPESRSDALRGIFLTAVPAAQDCRILCGMRQLRAGDTLTAAQLSALRITPCAEVDTVAALSYLPLYDDAAGAPNTLYLSLKGVRDQPPTAAASDTVSAHTDATVSILPPPFVMNFGLCPSTLPPRGAQSFPPACNCAKKRTKALPAA